MIREVSSMGHVCTRDNVNRGYPLTGWMPLPPLGWKAPRAGCIYREKKQWWHKWMAALSGVSSLFSITGLSLLVPVPAFVWHLQLEASYLSGCCEMHWRGFMDIHATYQRLFSRSRDERQASFLFFFGRGRNVQNELWNEKYKPMPSRWMHSV